MIRTSKSSKSAAKESKEVSSTKIALISIAVVIVIVFIWRLYWAWIEAQCMNLEARGQFGDMFGGITSLFTGLAFAGVIVTIWLQSHELKLQRRELIETKAEFKKQNLTLKYQRFENTFFNLTEQYNSLDKTRFSGRVTGLFQNHPYSVLKTGPELRSEYNRLTAASHDGKTRLSHCNLIEDEFGAHIKTFETIIQFVVDRKKKGGQARMKYFRIFFAQLTNFELILYFYHFYLRLGPKPPAFDEYWNVLFDPLHRSHVMPSGHAMELMNEYFNSNQHSK